MRHFQFLNSFTAFFLLYFAIQGFDKVLSLSRPFHKLKSSSNSSVIFFSFLMLFLIFFSIDFFVRYYQSHNLSWLLVLIHLLLVWRLQPFFPSIRLAIHGHIKKDPIIAGRKPCPFIRFFGTQGTNLRRHPLCGLLRRFFPEDEAEKVCSQQEWIFVNVTMYSLYGIAIAFYAGISASQKVGFVFYLLVFGLLPVFYLIRQKGRVFLFLISTEFICVWLFSWSLYEGFPIPSRILPQPVFIGSYSPSHPVDLSPPFIPRLHPQAQSMRYLSLVYRRPFFFSELKVADLPARTFSTVLESPRWDSLFFQRSYWDFLHSKWSPNEMALLSGYSCAPFQWLETAISIQNCHPISTTLVLKKVEDFTVSFNNIPKGYFLWSHFLDSDWQIYLDGELVQTSSGETGLRPISISEQNRSLRFKYQPVIFYLALGFFYFGGVGLVLGSLSIKKVWVQNGQHANGSCCSL